MKKKVQTFCIIGLTPFGQTIARGLEEQGIHVLVMDEEEELVQSVSEIATDAVVGDPMKEATLLAASRIWESRTWWSGRVRIWNARFSARSGPIR